MKRTGGLPRLVAALAAVAMVSACTSAAPQVVAPERSADVAVETGAAGQGLGTADVAASPAVGPVTFEDILALGEEMTAALDSGDVEQWMALTDLDDAAAQQQRDWFAGVQAVPMEVREMHPTFLVRTDDGQGRATAQFAFRHQVSGVDEVPVLADYELTLTASGDEWLVTEVTGAGGDDSVYPQLWDLGRVNVAEGGRVVVLYTGDAPPTDALRSLDDAVGAVLDQLPLPGAPRLLVHYADTDALSAMVGEDATGWHNSYALPFASPEVELTGHLPDLEDGDSGTPRLLVNRDEHESEADYYVGARGGSPLTRAGVSYMILSQRHIDFPAPEWVDTGMSWWFESSGDARVRDDLRWEYVWGLGDVSEVTGFPPDSYWLFYADEGTSGEYQYQALSIMRFLEERYGREVLVPLAEDLALVNIGAFDADEVMDQVFQEHLGADRDEIEADWVAWLQDAVASEEHQESGDV